MLFYDLFRLHAAENDFRAGDFGNVRQRSGADLETQSDHRFAPTAVAEKSKRRNHETAGEDRLLRAQERNAQRRAFKRRGIFRILKDVPRHRRGDRKRGKKQFQRGVYSFIETPRGEIPF